MIGQTLGHYRIEEKLGEGGMGVVWKAIDTTLDREIAIKVLPAEFSSDPERFVPFECEAKHATYPPRVGGMNCVLDIAPSSPACRVGRWRGSLEVAYP